MNWKLVFPLLFPSVFRFYLFFGFYFSSSIFEVSNPRNQIRYLFHVNAQNTKIDLLQYDTTKGKESPMISETVESENERKSKKAFEIMKKKKRLENLYKKQVEAGSVNQAFLDFEKQREEKLEKYDSYRYSYHLEHGVF